MDISVKVMLDVSPKLEALVENFMVFALDKANGVMAVADKRIKENKPAAEKKAEPKKAEAKPATKEFPGTEVPKAEAEKLKEIADLHDTDELTESDIVSLREKVVAFVQKDAEKNKPIFAQWLADHGLERITGIKTKAMAAELEAIINAG